MEVVRRLRVLGAGVATPEAMAEVTKALLHKREGVQSVAAQVLGTWGGRESVTLLRSWLLDCMTRPNGWAVQGVAVRQLAHNVGPEDVDWVMDLCFSVVGPLKKHLLLPLVMALPPEAARVRLTAGLSSPEWADRQAAVKAIGNMKYDDRLDLLKPLTVDPDPRVANSACLLSARS